MESKNIFDYIPEEIDGKEGKVKTATIKETPLIGIYFSAHWCPPCRGFTPILAKFYKVANEKKKQIEIIFVSFDRDEGGFNEYYATMPWLSYPFKDKEKMKCAQDFQINGIPAFLVFDKSGKLIDYDGRMSVQIVFKNDSGEDVANQIIEKWNKK